jgi:hypothetical protein
VIDAGWLLNGGPGFACPLKVDFEYPGLECPLNRNVAPRNAGGEAVRTGHSTLEISQRGFQNFPFVQILQKNLNLLRFCRV